SHDISESILTQAEEEKVNFILVGWHQDDRLSHYFDNITHQVISHARSHLGILKGYFPEDIKEIIVPFGGGESSQYAYFLARRLAHNIGAKVKLLRVVNPDIDSTSREKIQEDIIEQIQQQEMECECEVDYEILERFSITDALIETCNKSDFMILGDTNKRFKYNILGNIPDKVSRHSQGPLLLIKRYRQISKRGAKSYIFKKKAQRKKQD
ncbi:MAG: universal stress protein, partial [Bacillota bacterium]